MPTGPNTEGRPVRVVLTAGGARATSMRPRLLVLAYPVEARRRRIDNLDAEKAGL